MPAQLDDFEVRRQLVQMQMLYEVGLAIGESLDPAHVAEQVLHRALTAVDARAGMVLRRDAGDHAHVVSHIGFDGSAADLVGHDQVERAWRETATHRIDLGAGTIPRHLCAVPLRSNAELAGLLIVADKEERGGTIAAFDESDTALLDALAAQAANALRNARLYAELKAAQEKIAQLEQLRALGDLAGEVTHAMRHVLGLVIGNADAWLTLRNDPDVAMKAVLQAASSGQQLIDRIDRVTRLGVGREREKTHLNDIAAEALDQAQQLTAAATSVAWEYEAAEQLPATYLNPADITEVVVNLLLNAAQAIPASGTVRLRTALIDGQLQLSVADTGHGIPADVQERIFDPFFTTREGTGTGLGLSIVLRIVEDHGGSIAVDSTSRGSTFTVRLPVTDVPPADALSEDMLDDAEDPGRR